MQVIEATPEHPFYVANGGWTRAGQLGLGTSIVTRAGPALVVTATQTQSRPEGFVVYNLTVEDDHTFFVGTANGGAWVHNDGKCDNTLRRDNYPSRVRPSRQKELEGLARDPETGEMTFPSCGNVINGKGSPEHQPSVVEHWNATGYNTTQDKRIEWYNKNVVALHCLDCQKVQGGILSHQFKYRTDLGPNYVPRQPRVPR